MFYYQLLITLIDLMPLNLWREAPSDDHDSIATCISQGVHEKRGSQGFTKRGVHVNTVNPLATGLLPSDCVHRTVSVGFVSLLNVNVVFVARTMASLTFLTARVSSSPAIAVQYNYCVCIH